MPLNAVAYYRVSSSAQGADDRQSLPAQHEDAEAYCARLELAVVASFEDVESGTHVGRESYQRMLALVRKGGVEAIVVREFARFGRERWEAIGRVSELMALGVEVHEYGDGNVIRRGDDGAFFSTAFKAYSADRQSQETRRNARRGQQRAMEQGRFIGTPPYGYQKDGAGVRVYEPEAKVVRQVYAWYAYENRSLIWIAQRLNALRVKTSRRGVWASTQVHQMLRRPAYMGTWQWGADTLTIPPIVSPDLWALVQSRCDRKRELPFGRTQSSGYLLSGVVKCGLCGSGMLGYTPKTGEGRRGYRCGQSRFGACENHRGVRADDLEAAVVAYVEGQMGSVTAVRTAAAMDVQDAEDALRRLRDERGAVLRRRDEMLRSLLRGGQADLVAALAEEEVEALDEAVADAARTLINAHARSESASDVADRWHSFAEALATDRGAAKALLQSLVRRVTVTPDTDPVVELA